MLTYASFEIEDGEYIAEPVFDVTDLLGKDELIDHQNELVCLQGHDCRSCRTG